MSVELFELIDKEGIYIEWWDFSPPLEAVYWSFPGLPPIIGLSGRLKHAPSAYFRCVLAEELGHHYTSTADSIPQTFFHYRDRLEVSKAEYRALKWAALHLMPFDDVLQAVSNGLVERWQLAGYFNVTEQMVDMRISLFKADLEFDMCSIKELGV